MTNEAIELMFASSEAIVVTHYPPGGASAEIVGLFAEADSEASESAEARDGLRRQRSGKLVIRSDVAVTLGLDPSKFRIREEIWKSLAVLPCGGVQIVRLERTEQSTQRRPGIQHHQ